MPLGGRARRDASTARTRSATATPIPGARSSSSPSGRPASARAGRAFDGAVARGRGPCRARDSPARPAGCRSGWARRDERDGTLVLRAMMEVELQVIGSALRAVAEEMGAVLIRSAFSANIKERRDCSTAIFDEAGAWSPRRSTSPSTSGRCRRRSRRCASAGPAAGRGLHPQRPVHGRDAPARRHARLAHRGRVRGLARAPCRRRRDGAREPARVLARALPGGAGAAAGAARPTRSCACSSRTSATRTSAAATCARSSRRTGSPSGGSTELCARRGRDRVAAAMDELYAYSERLVRAAIARLPDGRWEAEDRLEPVDGELSIRARSRSPATRSRSTSPAPRRSTPATSTARSR